jgi:hypothetical protein
MIRKRDVFYRHLLSIFLRNEAMRKRGLELNGTYQLIVLQGMLMT